MCKSEADTLSAGVIGIKNTKNQLSILDVYV